MVTRRQWSIGEGVVIPSCRREILVEKVTMVDCVMVREAARRDVVFSKLLGITLSRCTLAQSTVTCTQLLPPHLS